MCFKKLIHLVLLGFFGQFWFSIKLPHPKVKEVALGHIMNLF